MENKIDRGLYVLLGLLLAVVALLLIMHITDKRHIIELRQVRELQEQFLKKEESLLMEISALKTKAVIDSVNFEQKLTEARKVKVKYEVIRQQVETMPLDVAMDFFYSYTSPDNPPEEVKVLSTNEVVVQDSIIQNANLLFVDRDFYRELSDTLEVAILAAKTVVQVKSDIISKQEVVIKDHQVELEKTYTILNDALREQEDSRKKLRKARWVTVGAITAEVITLGAIFLF